MPKTGFLSSEWFQSSGIVGILAYICLEVQSDVVRVACICGMTFVGVAYAGYRTQVKTDVEAKPE